MSKLNTFLQTPILIGAVASALIGCGTKGPLYIPEQRYPQETNAPASDTSKIEPENAPPRTANETQPIK